MAPPPVFPCLLRLVWYAAGLVAWGAGGLEPAAAQVIYHAEALGATGDDPRDDDTPGIQAALDAAIHFANLSGQNASVLLAGGAEYRLKSGKRGRGHLDLSCLEDGRVTLDGQGATIVVETPRLGVLFAERSRGLVIQNLVLDLDPLPFLAARVESTDATSRTVLARPLPGATELSLFPDYSDEWGWLHDPEVWHRPLKGAASSFKAETRSALDDGRLRFVMRAGTAMQDFSTGNLISFHYRRGNNVRLQLCEDVTLRNVMSFGAGLFFVSTSHVTGLTVERCAVLARSGRVQATGGDGVHLKYGRDVVVRDCYFEGLSDDAVNVSATIGFTVIDCAFVDKRRHGIVLDTDGVPYRSRDGRITGNVVARNGGSALHHDGGDYRSVLVAGNTGQDNDLARAVERARPGRWVALESEGAGRCLGWSSDGHVTGVSLEGAGSPVGEAGLQVRWRTIREATDRGHRVRLEALASEGLAHPWLYLGAGRPAGELREDAQDVSTVTLEASVRGPSPRRARRAGPDRQTWIEERAADGEIRLLHELTGKYLTVGGNTAQLGARETATRWRFQPEP